MTKNSYVVKTGQKIKDVTIKIKYVGGRRDYGNVNQGFEDVILSKYFLADYFINYNFG